MQRQQFRDTHTKMHQVNWLKNSCWPTQSNCCMRKMTNLHIYLHYNGNTTNPDLAIVTINLASSAKRFILDDLNSNHRAVITKIENIDTKTQRQEPQRPTWNFKRANWENYRMEIERVLKTNNSNSKKKPKEILKEITTTMIKSAKHNIPRGKTKKYKPFLNVRLQTLQAKRNRLRKIAEKTKKQADVQN